MKNEFRSWVTKISLIITAHKYFVVLLCLATMLKLFFASTMPFRTDMSAWIGWGSQLVEYGIPNFYNQTAWTDYTPGYFYILWLITIIKNALLPGLSGMPLEFWYKIPAIVSDLVSGLLIYLIVKNYSAKSNLTPGLVISAMYLFNPITTFNGAVWGQVDSVHVAPLLASAYAISLKRLRWGFVLFTAACVVKPLAGLMAPVYIYLLFKQNWKEGSILTAFSLSTFMILAVPFWGLSAPFKLFEQLESSYELYPYASLNTFNFWGAFGMWVKDSELIVAGLSAKLVSNLLALVWFGLTTIMLIKIGWKKSWKSIMPYWFLFGSMYVLGGVTFLLRMHERYIYHFFPLLLLFLGFLLSKRYYVQFYAGLFIYLLLSVLHLINLYYVYVMYLFWDTQVPLNDMLYWWIAKNTVLLSVCSSVVAIGAMGYAFAITLYPHRESGRSSI